MEISPLWKAQEEKLRTRSVSIKLPSIRNNREIQEISLVFLSLWHSLKVVYTVLLSKLRLEGSFCKQIQPLPSQTMQGKCQRETLDFKSPV